MQEMGLEPTCYKALISKSSVYANSTTLARREFSAIEKSRSYLEFPRKSTAALLTL